MLKDTLKGALPMAGALSLILAFGTVTGCDSNDAEDAADNAADTVEDAAEETGEAIDDAVDEVDDAIEDPA